MGDSTEKNLKSYRNSELKWFLLANILLMLVTSGGLKFDSQDANVFSFISEIISITAVSSCAYILTFIFDSILPPIFKVKLIFWWKKQPSCTIFTDMLKNLQDNRFTLSTVLEKYNDIYDTEHDTITLRRSVQALFRAAAFAFYPVRHYSRHLLKIFWDFA